MPSELRQRGALSTRYQQDRSQQWVSPRMHLWAGVAVAALVAIAVLVAPSDDNRTRQQAADTPDSATIASTETEPTAPETPVASEEPQWAEQTVRKGDNLSLVFKRAGFALKDVHEVVTQSADGKLLERIFPGQQIYFLADEAGALSSVRYEKSPLETVLYHRGDAGFTSEVQAREPEIREAWAAGVINSSLFTAGQDAGLSVQMVMDLATIFGGVIDFVLDPRKGDTLHVVYEEQYVDGEKFADGNIVAASFTNQGKTFNAYRYADANGEVGYYNENGESMRKAFLLAPLDFTRISSNFNMRRLHPIYKTTRPHRGTDYAAPRGTPVYAAGDGKVIQAGYTRTNGNYVFIQHGDRYITHYLHLDKRKVKLGQRVTQSQVIGTVGSTGAATGPHLHYEFLVGGVHRDPRTVHKDLPKVKELPANELAQFRESISTASQQLAALRSGNQLAMNGRSTPKFLAN